ncbi:DUF6415 family natural product biosynthesis protein [Streptomyces sp. NBC_01343]|uniref:DUF6415 family natural product biosynthesis protein n=1 Tax=Streptomyces sp. NBC_01343 TaxID=2903832 RepID=UPI002E11EF84|nr:DUF6415 family natural product biosynthesis protein [Streptomyces sp. NBC_01343]
MEQQTHVRLAALTARALAPYASRPTPEDVAALVDDLITCGRHLHHEVAGIPATERTPSAADGLTEWEYCSAAGPQGSGPHVNWNHARGLARVLQKMARALELHRGMGVL